MLSKLARRVVAAASVAPTFRGSVAVTQAIMAMGTATSCCTALGLTENFVQVPPSHFHIDLNTVLSTFARVLIVPSLLEEVIWRVVLQPRGMTVSQIVTVNTMFSAYHLILAPLADAFNSRLAGASAVFSDPTFLVLAFVLGNLCTFVYMQSGYGLWAPVLTHAVTVTAWIVFFGGEKALNSGRK